VPDAVELTGHRSGTTLAELAALIQIPAWHADAETAEAPRAICAGCLVRAECLAAALQDPLTEGVWAGTTARERRQLRLGRVA
jgi:hypothetical protein